jgi:hypothetical protein
MLAAHVPRQILERPVAARTNTGRNSLLQASLMALDGCELMLGALLFFPLKGGVIPCPLLLPFEILNLLLQGVDLRFTGGAPRAAPGAEEGVAVDPDVPIQVRGHSENMTAASCGLNRVRLRELHLRLHFFPFM